MWWEDYSPTLLCSTGASAIKSCLCWSSFAFAVGVQRQSQIHPPGGRWHTCGGAGSAAHPEGMQDVVFKDLVMVGNGDGITRAFSSLEGKQRLVVCFHWKSLMEWSCSFFFLMENIAVKSLICLMNLVVVLVCSLTFLVLPFLWKISIFEILSRKQNGKPCDCLTS